jgi:hypothetical protein
MLINGAEGNAEFEAFLNEMVAKFGADFEAEHEEGTRHDAHSGGMLPPPPMDRTDHEGEFLPPPDGGDFHREEDYTFSDDPMLWDEQYIFDESSGTYIGFYDAQNEATQTFIDSNLNSCGHYCCPHPDCCRMFEDNPVDKSFCLAH